MGRREEPRVQEGSICSRIAIVTHTGGSRRGLIGRKSMGMVKIKSRALSLVQIAFQITSYIHLTSCLSRYSREPGNHGSGGFP